MQINITKIIPIELNQIRLDLALGTLIPEYSRSKIQDWIRSSYVLVDGKTIRPKDKVFTNQVITIAAPFIIATEAEPQPITLDIVYEDQDILIINKPVGLVVHPGAGCTSNTMLNALLYNYPELAQLPRAGIIHRLDKDTSGLLVVVRNQIAHTKLVSELQQRQIKREYVAIVSGVMTTGGSVDAPIGRHPTKRTHMAVVANGKPALTHYRIIQRFNAHTLLRVNLATGRTHQIRVHLSYIGYPIVGDQTYGKGLKIPPKCPQLLLTTLQNFNHQALHAICLGLTHPRTGQFMQWHTDPHPDIANLILTLNNESSNTDPL